MKLVDWAASARLSSARGSDEFIVRDHYAEDAIRVVVVLDRSPSMTLFPETLPWLHKPDAVRRAAGLVVRSGRATGALLGFAEATPAGVDAEPPRRDPELRLRFEHRVAHGQADGAPGSADRALRALLRRGGQMPAGTFVFVLSDFLDPPLEALYEAVAAGCDVVPVVIQDPTWERSFPDIGGVTLPLADVEARQTVRVRLSRRKASERRTVNELRASALDQTFRTLGIEPVFVTTSDPAAIHAAFTRWADVRLSRLRGYRR